MIVVVIQWLLEVVTKEMEYLKYVTEPVEEMLVRNHNTLKLMTVMATKHLQENMIENTSSMTVVES